MFLLKLIYKPFLIMFLLVFNFAVALLAILAKAGSICWAVFIWLIIGILIYSVIHQQWTEFAIAFCIGFATCLGASAIMTLGFIADAINEKLLELLAA